MVIVLPAIMGGIWGLLFWTMIKFNSSKNHPKTAPEEKKIPYICDFSRGGLDALLSNRIQTFLRGHKYRVSFLFGSVCLSPN